MREYILSPNAYDELLELAQNPCWGADYSCCLGFIDAAIQFGEAFQLEGAIRNERPGWIEISVGECDSMSVLPA
jgi:hypothetical protein